MRNEFFEGTEKRPLDPREAGWPDYLDAMCSESVTWLRRLFRRAFLASDCLRTTSS